MKFKSIFLFSFLLLALNNYAQPPLADRQSASSGGSFKDNLFFGGSLGLQFGSQTYVELAPIIGYSITERLAAGLGIKYIYYHFKDEYYNYNYSTNIYGGGPFLRYFVLEGLFLHTEVEVLNMEVPDPYYIKYTRENITSVFVGGGYRQMMGARSALDLLLLFNVNENRNSPYVNPILRIGFGFGI